MKGPDRQAEITESMTDLTAVKDNTYEDVPPYLKEEPPEDGFMWQDLLE